MRRKYAQITHTYSKYWCKIHGVPLSAGHYSGMQGVR